MRKIMKTEGAVRRMGYGSCLLLLLVLFSCTSIDETLPECRLYVRFRYDYNMEFTALFHRRRISTSGSRSPDFPPPM